MSERNSVTGAGDQLKEQHKDLQNDRGDRSQRVELVCSDGVRLAGHFFPAVPSFTTGPLATPPLPVLISPATGVKQHFYLRFAEWLSDQGHDVLVFDYRGVGLSLDRPLRGHPATLAQWGQQDQTAAVDWLLQRTGRAQLAVVGHSAGGQMLGLLPNHRKVAALVGVAASTGCFRLMRPGYGIPASLIMNQLLPLMSWARGYAPTSRLGLGEDLPLAVGRDWARWCRAGGYATNAVRNDPSKDFHREVQTPITALYAADDPIANAATVQQLVSTFPHASKVIQRVEPREQGLQRIGHIDWFRSSHRTLWPLIAAPLRGQSQHGRNN